MVKPMTFPSALCISTPVVKSHRGTLNGLENYLLQCTGFLKAKTKGFFVPWLRVARKSMGLLSFHPKDRGK